MVEWLGRGVVDFVRGKVRLGPFGSSEPYGGFSSIRLVKVPKSFIEVSYVVF